MAFAKINSIGFLMKSLRVPSSNLRNKCLFSALRNQSVSKSKISPIYLSSFNMSSDQGILKKYQNKEISSKSMSTDHGHSKIWTVERFLSAALLGLTPLALAYPNPVCDYALALALTAHVHWGLEAIVVDYARPNVVGAALSKASLAGVYMLTVFTLGGLFYFIYTDVGLAQAVRMLWKL